MNSNGSLEDTDKTPENRKTALGKFRHFLATYSWVLFALICLVISYLILWERGLYSDDYSVRAFGVDPVTGHSIPFWSLPNDHFPMRILVWMLGAKVTALVPDYEFWARLLQTFVQATASLLLGLLAGRVLKSKIAGVATGWLFICPVFATETVLWLTTVAYVVSANFALLSIISVQTATAKDQGRAKFIAFAVLLFTMMMFSFEGCMAAVGVAVLISFTTARREKHPLGEALKLTAFNTIWLVLAFGVIILIFRQAPLIASRGGVNADISFLIDRAINFLQRTYWLTLSPEWGGTIWMDSLSRGCRVIANSPVNLTLFLLGLVLLAVTAVTWRDRDAGRAPGRGTGFLLFFTGIAWALAALMIPGIFSKNQIVEYRMLYFPYAGVCVSIGALCWLLFRRLKFSRAAGKLIISAVGVVVLLNSVVMLGYCKLFAERYKIDREQIASVAKLLPSGGDWPSNTTLVFYNFDRNTTFEEDSKYVSNIFLFGVLETPWSAKDALAPVYKRNDFKVITANRFGGWSFSCREAQDPPGALQLKIQGERVSPENTIIVTYRDGNAVLVDELILKTLPSPGGAEGVPSSAECVVQFPLAGKLGLEGRPVVTIEEKASAK